VCVCVCVCVCVTCQITYWDAVDGSAIRIMDGSTSHEVSSLSIASDGSAFVSGGGDKIVKVGRHCVGGCLKETKGERERESCNLFFSACLWFHSQHYMFVLIFVQSVMCVCIVHLVVLSIGGGGTGVELRGGSLLLLWFRTQRCHLEGATQPRQETYRDSGLRRGDFHLEDASKSISVNKQQQSPCW
jgi:hypothetical protein